MRWIPRKIEAAAACRRVALMDVDCRGAIDCESARGPDADRHAKLLIHLAVEGSTLNAYSHLGFRRGQAHRKRTGDERNAQKTFPVSAGPYAKLRYLSGSDQDDEVWRFRQLARLRRIHFRGVRWLVVLGHLQSEQK